MANTLSETSQLKASVHSDNFRFISLTFLTGPNL